MIAQGVDPIVQGISSGHVRVVAAAGVADSATYQRVIRAFREQAPLPGLPPGLVEKQLVTISLAARMGEGTDAWAAPASNLIVMSLSDIAVWSRQRLHRVLRHELAHLGLARYLGGNDQALWFREGFAEWVASGVTCEGETRIRIYLHERTRGGNEPALLTLTGAAYPRLRYDLYASFFAYLEERSRAAVSRGELLSNVRALGLEAGMIRTFGANLTALEAGWRGYLGRRYGGPLSRQSPACPAQPDLRDSFLGATGEAMPKAPRKV